MKSKALNKNKTIYSEHRTVKAKNMKKLFKETKNS